MMALFVGISGVLRESFLRSSCVYWPMLAGWDLGGMMRLAAIGLCVASCCTM